MNKVSRDTLYELYVIRGKPMHELAKELGIAVGTVYNYLNKYGIKTREKSEAFEILKEKGWKYPQSARDKISKTHKGKTVSEETRKKISLSCEKLNVTREELNAMCPQEYYFDFMTWLCKMSGACAVWEKFIQRDKLTEPQIRALQMLKDNGLYLGEIPRMEGLNGII